jgi:DNA-binding NarL/FixJ family response regulator
MNCRDLLSPYARRKNNLSVERLEQWDSCTHEWVATLVDNRHTSIPDQVVLRIDVPDWLKKLSSRKRAIAQDLAKGDSVGEVSRTHGVSAARISQIRSELYKSWCEFHASLQNRVAVRGCES